MRKTIIKIEEKKVGNRIYSTYSFEKETPASLVIQHLKLTIKAIEEAVEIAVTEDVKSILKVEEFINDSTEDAFIKNSTHLMPMGRLSIEEPNVYWLKEN